ncbi:hypothetical protein PMAYCL1PPCAC_08721, partial [Pristionchus mayeri]
RMLIRDVVLQNMTESPPFVPGCVPDQDSLKCLICFKDLFIKRTLTLGCEHSFHRTCLLRVCESDSSSDSSFPCPTCNV